MTNPFGAQSPDIKQRRAAQTRFEWGGRLAITVALGFLLAMTVTIAWLGVGALQQTEIKLAVDLGPDNIDPNDLKGASYNTIVKNALKARFPEVEGRREKRDLYGILSPDAGFELKEKVVADPSLLGGTRELWFLASDDADLFGKGRVDVTLDQSQRRLNDLEVGWLQDLKANGELQKRFNMRFFTHGDSREPELAGILGALVGSAMSLFVCFILCFPVGVMAAIYLEEFAPKNRISDFIEVNINNLAAVPSIVFGLLGLAIFLNVFGLPRSSPLVGGMVLSLMTLPAIIIAARAALSAVPPSIREAALGLGASRLEATFHHVAPLAMPGMLTGAIVGMARALGETAPLLMIGMVAFIVDVPTSLVQPATALPVQIFLWADSPERAFMEKTSAAIIVLLFFLVVMNLTAILLRKRYEQRF